MGVQGGEGGKKVEVKTMRDVYELLAPVSSFTHEAFETVEEELVELIRFIENVVEASSKNDAKVHDYIKEFGGEVRLKAYRLLANLVYAQKTVDEDFAELTDDLADAFGIRE
jgi:uncharacterized tellurite resistance protein B-like protein